MLKDTHTHTHTHSRKHINTEKHKHTHTHSRGGPHPPDFTPHGPQPCQAWHSYRVTSAHHEEVGVSADGHASAPPPGPPPLRCGRAPVPLIDLVRTPTMPLFCRFCERSMYILPRRLRHLRRTPHHIIIPCDFNPEIPRFKMWSVVDTCGG
jgi:hypothetical protein